MGWLTVAPQIIAIGIVLWRKEVIIALIVGIFASEVLLLIGAGNHFPIMGFVETIERIIAVFANPGYTRLLLFSIVIGVLIAYMRHSGGITAFVEFLVNKGITKTKRQAGLLPFLIGTVLFMQSSISILTAGIVSRGLFDRFGMSRERLAYIVDVTSAPISVLILVNSWGAMILVNLNANGMENPIEVMIGTIGYNFYAWVSIALVLNMILFDGVFGPMKECEVKSTNSTDQTPEFPASKARFMAIPLFVMVSGIFIFLYWTGNGEITKGDGSKSILYSTVIASLVAYIMMLSSGRFTHIKLVKIGFEGMQELLQLVSIILLSLAFAASLNELGTGKYIAGIVGGYLPLILIAPVLFLTASVVSFSTGTSWGTIALFIPIGVPLIQQLGLPPSFIIAAILGGGVFGDHCSPISDSTVVSSLAAGCSLLDHIRTQLPYAMTAGAISFMIYLIVGYFVI